MKLYYTNGVCSLAVRIILNETNSLFEAEAVDLKTKQTALDKNFLENCVRVRGRNLFLIHVERITHTWQNEPSFLHKSSRGCWEKLWGSCYWPVYLPARLSAINTTVLGRMSL